MTDPLARAIGGTVDRAHHRATVASLGERARRRQPALEQR